MSTFQAEAIQLLSDLIRINTTNPPGNEIAAAHYLQSVAQKNDLYTEIFETAPGRGNLLVKYPGCDSSLSPLILLSHLDVVPADPSAWKQPPFGGVIQDGYIWGRGAVDTKQLTVMELMSLILLKRSGITPRQDIYLLATADEERGSQLGLTAFLETHGHIFKNAEVISEGGGFPIQVSGSTFYLCETGQKGPCIVRFRSRKQASANPFFPNLAGLQATSELILRLENFNWPGVVPETTQILLEHLNSAAKIDSVLSKEDKLEHLLAKVTPTLQKVLSAMVKNTMAVTIWNGGRKSGLSEHDNELLADVRLLPGVSRGELEEKLNELTAGLPIEWEILKFQSGYESSADSPLFRALAGALNNALPGAKVVPFLASGASDGRYLQSYGARVYGFSPVLIEDMTFDQAVGMVHGINERIAVDSLIFGTEILYAAVVSLCKEQVNDKH